jgi:hypothetical protein
MPLGSRAVMAVARVIIQSEKVAREPARRIRRFQRWINGENEISITIMTRLKSNGRRRRGRSGSEESRISLIMRRSWTLRRRKRPMTTIIIPRIPHDHSVMAKTNEHHVAVTAITPIMTMMRNRGTTNTRSNQRRMNTLESSTARPIWASRVMNTS